MNLTSRNAWLRGLARARDSALLGSLILVLAAVACRSDDDERYYIEFELDGRPISDRYAGGLTAASPLEWEVQGGPTLEAEVVLRVQGRPAAGDLTFAPGAGVDGFLHVGNDIFRAQAGGSLQIDPVLECTSQPSVTGPGLPVTYCVSTGRFEFVAANERGQSHRVEKGRFRASIRRGS